jgi:nicotinamidase-related amidase
MSAAKSAVIMIDVQESFRHRPYWDADEASPSLVRAQALLDGAKDRGVPVAQVFHVADDGPFALASGYVKTLREISIAPSAVFHKRSHSALIGTGLDVWLVRQGIRRLVVAGIRTEQCCETTARHASDLGYHVDYVTEATCTFTMQDRHGDTWTPDQIRNRTELVLEGRFARVATVASALDAMSVER